MALGITCIRQGITTCRFELDIRSVTEETLEFNPSNAELKPICHLLALLEAHQILHVSS